MKLVWVSERIRYVESKNAKVEWVIAYTSKRVLSRKELYSSNVRILSNYCDDNWFIYLPSQKGEMNKVLIHNYNKFIYSLP